MAGDCCAMPSIYSRLGGGDAVNLAVEQLYDRLVADDELAPYFAGTDVDRHARHVRPFIAVALGGPEIYRGRDMSAAHAGLGITDAHFDRTVQHVAAVLHGLGVGDELIGEVGATLEPLRSIIVQQPALRRAA
jgi:hemoglobin